MALTKKLIIEEATLDGDGLTIVRNNGVSTTWKTKADFKNSVQSGIDAVVGGLMLLAIAHHLKSDSNLDNVAGLVGLTIEIDLRATAGSVVVRVL